MNVPIKPSSKTRKILIGVFFILLGAAFAYFFIYKPLQSIQRQEEVKYYLKAMVLVPFSIVFGLYYIIFTPSGSGAWKELSSKEKPAFIAALVLSVLATAGLVYWFSSQLQAGGYTPIF